MVIRRFTASIAVLILVSCSSFMETTAPIEDGYHSVFDICRVREMAEGTGAVHIWHFPEPIRVRRVSGRIIFAGWDGSWYENSWPILKLRGPWKSQKIYEIHGDSKGRFALKHLPEGQYCFYASASCSGYHGFYGIIILDEKADKKKEIEIVLPFAGP